VLFYCGSIFKILEDAEMVVKIKPLYDKVLVKRAESEQKSAGGLFIPDTAQEKTQIGIVVAVGEGKLLADGSLRPLKVRVGDKIVFGKYSGTELKFDGEEYLITREEELLGIIEK
jgi:chaperonin GroES